jgi:mannose-1-phosphate guanylyltransferase
LSITADRKTMFSRTVLRARKLVRDGNIVVVANRSHARLVRRDFPAIKKCNLITEPVSRNTAPAIALAASELKRRGIDPVVIVLPTDQYIIDEKAYIDSLAKAARFAANMDAIVVIGVTPDSPSTEFGYIRAHEHARYGKGIYKVERFMEKPKIDVAKGYIKSGKFLWNTGAFVFRASVLLRALRYCAPNIARSFEDPRKALVNYGRLSNISIDHAVMQKAPNLYCVRGSYGWRDMGSFENVRWALIRESRDFLSRGDKILKVL